MYTWTTIPTYMANYDIMFDAERREEKRREERLSLQTVVHAAASGGDGIGDVGRGFCNAAVHAPALRSPGVVKPAK